MSDFYVFSHVNDDPMLHHALKKAGRLSLQSVNPHHVVAP